MKILLAAALAMTVSGSALAAEGSTFVGHIPPCDPQKPPLGGCVKSTTKPGLWLRYAYGMFSDATACEAYLSTVEAEGGNGGCI